MAPEKQTPAPADQNPWVEFMPKLPLSDSDRVMLDRGVIVPRTSPTELPAKDSEVAPKTWEFEAGVLISIGEVAAEGADVDSTEVDKLVGNEE